MKLGGGLKGEKGVGVHYGQTVRREGRGGEDRKIVTDEATIPATPGSEESDRHTYEEEEEEGDRAILNPKP